MDSEWKALSPRELSGIFPQIDRIFSTATFKRYFMGWGPSSSPLQAGAEGAPGMLEPEDAGASVAESRAGGPRGRVGGAQTQGEEVEVRTEHECESYRREV